MTADDQPDSAAPAGSDSDAGAYYFILAGLALTIAAAFGLGYLLSTPPLARFSFDAADIGAGIIATAPMIALLVWFMRTNVGVLAEFRESQTKFLGEIGFRFTPLRIAVLAIGAGISEELLFRGVLQEWAASFLPLPVAIVIVGVLFGLLHARTVIYTVIAMVMGVYFGVIFEASDNILAPMITHALYDAVALDFARRAIEQRQTRIAE